MAEKNKLNWYECIYAGLPLMLILIGGAIGGLVGAIAAGYNFKLFQSQTPRPTKYLLAGLISLMSPLIWFALSSLFMVLANSSFNS